MGDLSQHFSRREFTCHCGCGFDAISLVLVNVLEDVRNHFDSVITINSGCRCIAYNKKVGGVNGSQHVQGIAADIMVKGISTTVVADYLEFKYPGKYGIGRYSDFTHVDVRGYYARWRS